MLAETVVPRPRGWVRVLLSIRSAVVAAIDALEARGEAPQCVEQLHLASGRLLVLAEVFDRTGVVAQRGGPTLVPHPFALGGLPEGWVLDGYNADLRQWEYSTDWRGARWVLRGEDAATLSALMQAFPQGVRHG